MPATITKPPTVKPKRTTAPERFTEYVSGNGPLVVDREAGVIRGVRILGLKSKNGREYRREAVASAIGLYEGVRVNVDHPRKGQEERSYHDRLGVLRNVRQENDGGLRGDLHYNPKHSLAEQLAWDAEHAPEKVGLSHNVLGRTKRQGNVTHVESIEAVQSVDLVADPATNQSLFESASQFPGANTVSEYADLTVEEIKRVRPDLVSLIESSVQATQKQVEAAAVQEAKLKELQEKLAVFEAREALAAVNAEIEKLVSEAKLPAAVVTEEFKAVLRESKDTAARKALVETLSKAIGKVPAAKSDSKPISRDQFHESTQSTSGTPTDGKSFARLLTAA